MDPCIVNCPKKREGLLLNYVFNGKKIVYEQ
jgi:hypothetical protein